jgi:hypothetical protein
MRVHFALSNHETLKKRTHRFAGDIVLKKPGCGKAQEV